MSEHKNAPTAVALAYGSSDPAPKVVAKGRGLIAEEIIHQARQHGVFVHESRELVALLMQVDLDRHVPAALYRAVAELLAWLCRVDAGQQNGDGASPPPNMENAETER